MTDLDSYPPALRHHLISHHPSSDDDRRRREEPDLDGITTGSHAVPVIDLECLLNEDDEMMKKLDEACKDWGIFRLANHGVPLTLISQLHDVAKQLFCMPFESKHASFGDGSGGPVVYFWGTPALTAAGRGVSGDPNKINFFEGFNVPLAPLHEFQPQLPLLECFRAVLFEYGKHLSRIVRSLFEAMAKKLDLSIEKSMMSSYVADKKTGFMRVYRYPRNPNSDNNVGSWGMEPHTDSSVLSILNLHAQDSGLEVLRDHQWLPVQSIPNTLTVNIGDMMQAISDDRYKSALHRVKINQEKERISVCYFVFPDDDLVIQSSNYKPFTYSHFRSQVQHDIKTIGHKVGLSRFAHQTS
ncbi:gibberellin 2-beta-dioxygenase 5 isoform X2 [Prosopis cineraria]|uniref:gibberellin 2-beta-dioxygenase 5 isoform X2 n=1 Tax=Prosopis cineraria TaxID=364024 RepID=UPI0024105776|nr:gibberellin 2-beta-dioxygenase 5 isoform X2 [Prosopis cineraria]